MYVYPLVKKKMQDPVLRRLFLIQKLSKVPSWYVKLIDCLDWEEMT